ncbi:MAG: hypothetical protein AB7R89_06175 [Dehalococcoidia bacterium]
MVAELIRVGSYTAPSPVTLPDELRARLRDYTPKGQLGAIVRSCFRHLPADLAGELLDAISSCVVLESSLGIVVFRRGGVKGGPILRVEDYGIVSRKLITNTGVAFLVDAWQNSVELENLKYHGLGTGSTAENASDSALVTELTTEYNPNGTRATGSTTEASAAVFRTVGTNTLDATPGGDIEEHGVFSAASSGVLWDRSLTGGQSLSSGDGIQSTYDMTASAGG